MTPAESAERARLVAAVESTPHFGHGENEWAQGCKGCEAMVALASFDQPSFYVRGTAAFDAAHKGEG